MKRFIGFLSLFFFFTLVLGINALMVKQTFAAVEKDEIIGFPNPQTIELKKNGPVVLYGLLREETLDLTKHLVSGQNVLLKFKSLKKDRNGRSTVRLLKSDRSWIAAELVRNGLARVYPEQTYPEALRELYIHENAARTSRLGYWKTGEFQIFDALTDEVKINDFSVIEGQVIDIATIRDRTYINFGSNWRTDVSAFINKKNLSFFREFGWDVSILKGKQIQIRGWVFEQNGPMIELDHPLQLQLMN